MGSQKKTKPSLPQVDPEALIRLTREAVPGLVADSKPEPDKSIWEPAPPVPDIDSLKIDKTIWEPPPADSKTGPVSISEGFRAQHGPVQPAHTDWSSIPAAVAYKPEFRPEVLAAIPNPQVRAAVARARGYTGDLSDEALADAYKSRDQGLANADAGHFGASLGRLLTGAEFGPIDTQARNEQRTRSSQGIRDIEARRKAHQDSLALGHQLEDRQVAQEEKAKAASRQAELDDATSDVSAEAREIFAALRPEVANRLGPRFALLSASALAKYDPAIRHALDREDKYLELLTRTEQAERAAAARDEETKLRRQEMQALLRQKRSDREIAADEKRAVAEEKKAEAAEKRREAALVKFGKDVKPDEFAGMMTRLDAAEAIIRKLDQDAGGPDKADLPGFGEAASKLPDILISPQGVHLRQILRGVASEYIKTISGAAVTAAEEKRLLSTLGLNDGATEQQLRDGIRQLRAGIRATYRARAAAHNPEAAEAWRQQAGALGDSLYRDDPEIRVETDYTSKVRDGRTYRTDHSTGETRYWNGSAWVKE